ncbi:hypothetical protein R3P38DRAFT_2765571 [Favolaschia claudopus]|uniref:Helicase C-terminal domain-containing protein n=1 Tax=Favolaschia claudopus TaxID=2862362 RepID=A0AAW0D7P6_9AGAR
MGFTVNSSELTLTLLSVTDRARYNAQKWPVVTTEFVQGFNVPSIRLIVKHGVTKTVAEDDQRGGRGGRNGMECLVLTIAEKWVYENLVETDPDHKPSKKEQRTEKEDCHHSFLARHNNDTTSSATSFTCSNCCDHHLGFNLSHYLPSLKDSDSDAESDSPPHKPPRQGYRPLRARATLEDAIHSWTKMTHQEDPILKTFPRDWTLSDGVIFRLDREKAQFFQIPRDITDFLKEDNDWHSCYALEVLTVQITDFFRFHLSFKLARFTRGSSSPQTIDLQVADTLPWCTKELAELGLQTPEKWNIWGEISQEIP